LILIRVTASDQQQWSSDPTTPRRSPRWIWKEFLGFSHLC